MAFCVTYKKVSCDISVSLSGYMCMTQDKMDSLNEFLELSADELKLYLQQRGQPSSGTHGSLAARALIAHEQGLPIMLSAKQF